MAEGNGNNGKAFNILITIFLALFSVIVFPAMFFLSKEVIANERDNVREHAEIKKCMVDYIIPMKDSIARIETKLETRR